MKETLRQIRQKNLEEAEMIKKELEMTMDANGKTVPAVEVLDDENIVIKEANDV
jgi:hypothetical protein